MKKALWFFLIFIVCQVVSSIFVNTIMTFLPSQDKDITMLWSLVGASALSSVVAIALFLCMKWCPVSMRYLSGKPWKTLLFTVILSASLILPSAWTQEMLPDVMQKDLLQGTFELLLNTPWGYIVIGFFAPFVEEMVFRGAILRSLLQWRKGEKERESTAGIWLAITISAAMFSLMHMNPAQMPHAFVIGLLLGWLYQCTGSIVPGVVYHWVNNTVAFLSAYCFPEIPYDAKLIEYFNGNQELVLIAVIISLVVAIPCVILIRNSSAKP